MMPNSVPCTGCRSPIEVPDGHAEPSIRCGICWTQVPLAAAKTAAAKPTARPVAALVPPVAVAKPAPPRPSPVVPAVKPPAGMGKLEALIQKAAAKLAPPAAAPARLPVAVALPVPKPAPAATPAALPTIEVQPLPKAATPVIVPVPVPVTPVFVPSAYPVAGPRELADDPPPKARERPSSRRRHDRDDDDDNDDRRRPRGDREAKNGPMIALIVGGLAVFVGLCVGGYYLSRIGKGRPAEPINPEVAFNNQPVIQFNLPNADAQQQRPNPLLPNNPFAQIPGVRIQIEWTEYAGHGFKAKFAGLGRGRPTEMGASVQFHDDDFPFTFGRGTMLRPFGNPSAQTEVIFVDAPQGVTPDLKKIVADPFGRTELVVACKVAGKDGFEITEQRAGTVTTRIVRVGCRVFLFRFTSVDGFADAAAVEAAKKTFFDSISITFDPATPAPVDPNLRPRRKAGGIELPGVPNAGIAPPAGRDALKLVTSLDTFHALVVLPDRGEAFAVGGWAVGPGRGELRRYEYPGFKLKNTYHLPAGGTMAVASDQLNRLAITTTRADAASRGERVLSFGDVHVYDLAPIFADAVGNREELKPVGTLTQPANTRLVGLELSPDGRELYYLGLSRGTPKMPAKVRLTKADLQTAKVLGTLDLPEPAWRLRLSADGKKLFAAEVPVTPTGAPNPASNRATNLVTVDVPRWQLDRTHQLAAGTAFDFIPVASDTIVASVGGGGGNFSLWAVKAGGPAVALDPPGQAVSRGYLARTPDGKRLVTSTSGPLGGVVEVYDVSDWTTPAGFKRVASARTAKPSDRPTDRGVDLGHNFALTPDGKFAVFCASGAVVDLTAIK